MTTALGSMVFTERFTQRPICSLTLDFRVIVKLSSINYNDQSCLTWRLAMMLLVSAVELELVFQGASFSDLRYTVTMGLKSK